MLTEAFSYKRWADERTLSAIQRVNSDAHAEGYAFLLQQLNHMVIVEELFKSRLSEQSPPHTATNTDKVPDLKELASRLRISSSWYAGYVASSVRLDERVCFVFADGMRGAMSVEEILFHILTHGSYHRGNIAHALDLADIPHPADGYAIYVHEKEPQRRDR